MRPEERGERTEAYGLTVLSKGVETHALVVGEVGGQTTGRKIGQVIRRHLRKANVRIAWGRANEYALVKQTFGDEWERTTVLTVHYPGGMRTLSEETRKI